MSDETPAPNSAPQSYRWQGQDGGADDAVHRRARRRNWLIGLAALGLGLASLAIVWILLLKPRPPAPVYLSITIDEYTARPYPVVPFALQDRERIARHFVAEKLKRQAETKTGTILRKALLSLADKSEPIVIHIAALALARGDKVYLLPGDADPEDESTWLDVNDVIEAVGNCKSAEKLLILDLAQRVADSRIGVLSDRVAEVLEARLKKDAPSFYVMCPCAAGQRSFTSEVLGGSTLVHYLDRGLLGAADADDDKFITVTEAFGFAAGRVDRWAQDNRGARQTPQLFGSGRDFCLVNLFEATAEEIAKPTAAAFPKAQADAWKKRDLALVQGAVRQAPRPLIELEAHLLRRESRWRGSLESVKDFDAADAKTRDLTNEIAQAVAPASMPRRSLWLVLPASKHKADAVLVASLRDALFPLKGTGAKKEALAKTKGDLAQKLGAAKDADSYEKAFPLLEALGDFQQPGPDQILVVRETLASLKPAPDCVEAYYLQRLAYFAERYPDSWPAEHVAALLKTVRSREKVVAHVARAPLFLPWVAPALEGGDDLRRKGERKLLWGQPSGWDEGLRDLTAADAKYAGALADLDLLRRCRNEVDQALHELPSYLRLLAAWPDLDALGEQSFGKAVDEAVRLQEFFAAPAGQGAIPTPDDRPLRDLAKRLHKRIDGARFGGTGLALRQIHRLLESPLLTAKDRAALFANERKLALTLDAKAQKKEEEDPRGKIPARPADPPLTPSGARAMARARMSLALLRLGGVESKMLSLPAGDDGLTEPALASTERALHDRWAKDLPRQWNNPKTPAWADALNRLAPPWLAEKRVGGVMPISPRLRQQQELAFFRWLEKQYQSEGSFLQTSPRGQQDEPARLFCIEAAREVRSMIRERE